MNSPCDLAQVVKGGVGWGGVMGGVPGSNPNVGKKGKNYLPIKKKCSKRMNK